MFYNLRGRAGLIATAAIALVFCAFGSRASAIVYAGAPDLGLTARVVAAGSEDGTFHARTLFARAFDDRWPAEEARLQTKYGAQRVSDCFAVLDYTIGDALRIVKRDGVEVPVAATTERPLPDELWQAGQTPQGRYDVGYMLERMVTHQYHHEIMQDLDARFGHATNASFHIVLANLIEDGHSNP